MDLVQAIIILIVGYWLAGKLSKATGRWLDRFDRFERVDSMLKPLFSNIVRYVVIIITIVAVLE